MVAKKEEEPKIDRSATPATRLCDINVLAKCVSIAETGNCKKGSAKSNNNCFGIMEYSSGERRLKKYYSINESFVDFKKIWSKNYGEVPNRKLAWRWVCGGNAKNCDEGDVWLKNVMKCYNS